MSQDTTNAIMANVAIVALVISIFTSIINIVLTIWQSKKTEDLTILTSNLDHRVHRLSTNLDHRIYRLERVRDLITGLVQTTIGLRQGSRPHIPDKLDLNIKREMTFPELGALVMAIKDEKLKTLYSQLVNILSDKEWPKLWNEMPYDMGHIDELSSQQSNCTEEMHQRILELIEDATQAEDINALKKAN